MRVGRGEGRMGKEYILHTDCTTERGRGEGEGGEGGGGEEGGGEGEGEGRGEDLQTGVVYLNLPTPSTS